MALDGDVTFRNAFLWRCLAILAPEAGPVLILQLHHDPPSRSGPWAEVTSRAGSGGY